MAAPPAAAAEAFPVERLARLIADRRAQLGRPIAVGIGGAQGAGKSTLAALLLGALEAGHDLRALTLSLDDFYLTRAERARLAATVHPELATRGPGTHDVALAERTLRASLQLGALGSLAVPRFDKARDDRLPEDATARVGGPLDVVLLEGVLVCVPPEPEADLAAPVNDFERTADADGRLRRHARAQHVALAQALDPLLDLRVFLAVPDLEHVLAWRTEQERALGDDADARPRGMDPAALARFVQRFERSTRHALHSAPALADVTLELDEAHRVRAVRLSARAAEAGAR